MSVLELKPEQLPLVIRLKTKDQDKDYVLIKTKQDKLLLNKPNEVTSPQTK
jgi:hypothetical protein